MDSKALLMNSADSAFDWYITRLLLVSGKDRAIESYLFDNAVILFLVPVKAQLTDPLKVIGIGAANLAQLLNHIPGMHLNCDQGHNLYHSYIASVLADQLSHACRACPNYNIAVPLAYKTLFAGASTGDFAMKIQSQM